MYQGSLPSFHSRYVCVCCLLFGSIHLCILIVEFFLNIQHIQPAFLEEERGGVGWGALHNITLTSWPGATLGLAEEIKCAWAEFDYFGYTSYHLENKYWVFSLQCQNQLQVYSVWLDKALFLVLEDSILHSKPYPGPGFCWTKDNSCSCHMAMVIIL